MVQYLSCESINMDKSFPGLPSGDHYAISYNGIKSAKEILAAQKILLQVIRDTIFIVIPII